MSMSEGSSPSTTNNALENFPGAASATDQDGRTKLHVVCENKNATLESTRLLVDAFPGALRQRDLTRCLGWMPLHSLCGNSSLDAAVELEILNFFLEKCPESVRHADSLGDLPIHLACGYGAKSPEFCRTLIEAYPGSEWMANNRGELPFHLACAYGTVATAEYLYNLYPKAINMANEDGLYPIHFAMVGMKRRNGPATATAMVRFLLGRDGRSLLQVNDGGWMPIHFLCVLGCLDAAVVALEILKLLVEKCPESVRHADSDGYLPIHLACGKGAKSPEFCRILIEAYPESAQSATDLGALPFHLACMRGTVATAEYLYNLYPKAINIADEGGLYPIDFAMFDIDKRNVPATATEMVRFLLDRDGSSLHQQDNRGWMPIHYLCVSKCLNDAVELEILKLLVEKCPESVQHADRDGYLPIHLACGEGAKSPEFCRILIEAYPESAQSATDLGALPFHLACMRGTVATAKYLYPDAINMVDADINGWYPISYVMAGIDKRNDPSTTTAMVRFLLGRDGRSLLQVNDGGWMPIHFLCVLGCLNDAVELEILKLLVEKCPESVQHADRDGYLPIHLASGKGAKSPEFCRTLIEAYPGSEWMANNRGALPFHLACMRGTVATAKYLYELYPDAINMADEGGLYPIHYAIQRNFTSAIEMVRFLLDCDPNVALQESHGTVPLGFSCSLHFYGYCAATYATLDVMRLLYDAHPEAIERNEISSNVGTFCQEVQTFVETQLAHARQARDHRLMTTPDENGQLPLHRALCDNATLGSIKLLVKGNPSAVSNLDRSFALPLHVACQYHDSTAVVQYLIGLVEVALIAMDREGNSPLHYACRGAKHNTIALLLETYGAVSVSKRNARNKLPIYLLLESDGVSDRESIEYTDSIYRLIRAYPETLMDWNFN